MTVNGHDVSVEMVKNGQRMMEAYSSRSAWDTATISVALAIVKGDKSIRVLGYPVLESSIPFSHQRSCFASE
uniref:Uncharacterized protein n=1 Tax=Magallana gigas TaxID=29159 RepID=K1PCG0_MAGGI